MSIDERNELISWLVIWTRWRSEAFEDKSNAELLRMADRYNEK